MTLDEMIKNHSRLASKFKRESNTPLNRYHHGFAEGLRAAKKIMEVEDGKE